MRQLIFALIIAVLAVVFALQNSDPVVVRLFYWDLGNASMALVLLITFIIGIITGLLMMAMGIYKRNHTINAQKKRIIDLESQLASIRK
jgi:putative membrane protein